MDRSRVDLRLVIIDFEDITHDDITNMLGINPTHTSVKGDKRSPNKPNSPLKTNNSWSMDSGLGQYASFEDQMSTLLDMIEQRIDVFKMLSTNTTLNLPVLYSPIKTMRKVRPGCI